ncbi:MAG: RimK/LysX family protein [Parvibaculaceae bacterium]|nr:RimK/LysX family protein [Parvibaculaceae bacterium]
MKKRHSNEAKRGGEAKGLGHARRNKIIIGWREWVTLPELGTPPIKAKIDTGARTSALHAFRMRHFTRDGAAYVEFYVHPEQHRRKPEIRCEAPLLEERQITSSNGQKELRCVIETQAEIGGEIFDIELTLTNRDELGFRMLIGRQALRGHFIIDPGQSYCADAGS